MMYRKGKGWYWYNGISGLLGIRKERRAYLVYGRRWSKSWSKMACDSRHDCWIHMIIRKEGREELLIPILEVLEHS
jgi:hypothetical protein